MGQFQKRGNNTYFLTVSAGKGINGRYNRYTKTVKAKDDDEAQKLLWKFEEEVLGNQHLKPDKFTFKAFVAYWLEKYAEIKLEEKTVHRYKELLDERILPALGPLQLRNISATHLIDFYETMRKPGARKDKKTGGLADRTIHHHHRLIHTILEFACKWQFVSENIAARVDAPIEDTEEIECFNEKELKQLIELLPNAKLKFQVAITLAIYTGMRRGEICGLKWENIDYENNVIEIKKANQYISGKGTFTKKTKNKTSRRNITVPGPIMELIKLYEIKQDIKKKKLKELYIDNGFIFTQWNGKAMHPDTLTGFFAEFLAKYELRHVSLHSLRHSHASLLIGSNTDVLAVSKRLGHALPATTLNKYGHALKKVEYETSNQIEKLLEKVKEKESD